MCIINALNSSITISRSIKSYGVQNDNIVSPKEFQECKFTPMHSWDHAHEETGFNLV